MSVVWLGLGLGILQLLAGIVIGCSLARRMREGSRSADAAHLQMLAADVRGLIHDVHDDVDEHHSQMQRLSEQLHADPGEPVGPAASIFHSVSLVIQANERLQGQLVAAERQLKEQERQIAEHIEQARTDHLTRLPNRRAFDDWLVRQAALHSRAGIRFGALMLDVDHFKNLNDRWGHPCGDQVLREVTRAVRRTARPTDLVARVGGEEFAVVLPNTNPMAIAVAAERIRRAVEEADIRCEGIRVPVTMSVGAAMIAPGESVEALLGRADAALYASKQAGRNCSHWHDGTGCRPIGPTTAGDDPEPFPAFAQGGERWEEQGAWRRVCDDLRRRLSELVGGDS